MGGICRKPKVYFVSRSAAERTSRWVKTKNKLSRLLRDFNNYFILYIFFISIKSSGRVVLKKIIYNNIYKN